ncbi:MULTISPECIES: enoyl-CoA hydratase/isomerase family protein [Tsukamurella]|uniref:Enoyl-CoA hydratase/isomerase family protein n=2 Tax=Tsukamurella TaxID=2060 RepID=A0A5C5RYH5_9ACTN|nr:MULTISPECIES: enoyl-CoA hydratase/isomerase family protein [Tsukamurella]NMD56579.1 enoyl-CoA hydratase/isomerase family protein [Tsukamurella columbiensis]TWS27490.1 enoyl-CoA hydratase/isomerase family protein [Tsukamurella conjunctivitidis]
MVNLTRDGAVLICDLGDGENRLDGVLVGALHAVLDDVESASGPAALVTTGSGRFYSNGLEPESFALDGYLDAVQSLLGRLLGSGVPTVAALQGHTYAGGLLLALAHDRRVMRADRGYLCLPEARLGFPFLPGMSALVAARVAPAVAHAAMVTAERYDADAAVNARLVDEIAEPGEVLATAVDRAAELAPLRGSNLAAIKRTLYRDALDRLAEPAILPAASGA